MSKSNIFILILLIFGIYAKGNAFPLENSFTVYVLGHNTNCLNEPNGSASVTAIGGKKPYSYEWSNGETTAEITGLKAGRYEVTVTDAEGNEEDSFVIINASNLALKIYQYPSACAYQSDGKITVIPQGGEAPFTYNWSTGSNEATIDSLAPGMYMVTVEDANGCSAEEGIMLMEPDPLRVNADYVDVSCGETADAYMEVMASGGTAPYTYLWAVDSMGGTKREGLVSGLYSVTITDANGCTAMICPEIKQSVPPGLVYSSIPETCPGEGNGSAIITPSGNSPPYRYEWPDGVNSQFSHASNLTAGIYTVTVTNFRNCSATIDVEVGQAGGGFGFIIESKGIACGNLPNGQASVIMTGGVAPFKYEWKNENTNAIIGNNASVDNLSPGSYSVLVSDANGCFGKRDLLIIEKPIPTVTAMATNPKVCFGEATGSIMAVASGGEGDFTYQWSNGATGAIIENLMDGVYTVTAMDANGCTATANAEIIESNQITIAETVTDLLCYREPSGEISISVNGGTAPYTYEWSNGITTNSIKDVLAGTHFVTVTDADACQVIKGININEPIALNISVTITNSSDLNSSDGAIEATVSGGTAPYTYEWSNGATTQKVENLAAGEYSLTVTDANGCQQTITDIIIEPECTLMATILAQATACALNDGAINLTISGAKGALSYQWTNGATSESITGLTPGYYGVTITDGTGCENILSTFVKNGCNCTQPIIENIVVFEATCGKSDGSLAIQMKEGADNFNFEWASSEVTGASTSNLPAGSYEVTISDKNDAACAIREVVNIGNTNIGPVLELQKQAEICNGQKGSVLLVPAGLTYTWSDGMIGNERTDLSAGTYQVSVTNPALDSCLDILTVEIALETGIIAQPVFNKMPDCGMANGSVTIEVMGGSGNYDFSWGAATRNNLPAGTYNIEIKDKNTGCISQLLFVLQENTGTNVQVQIDSLVNVSCVGANDGKIAYQLTKPADFNEPETILITDGNGVEYDANALPAGAYCLTIKDADDCHVGQTCFTISEPDHILVNVTTIPKTCDQGNTILLTTSGGNGSYTYNWADQNGDINPRDRRDVENGAYSVVVTDIKGCAVAIDSINVNGECFVCTLEATASIQSLPDCGQANGAASINVINSIGNLSFEWDGTLNDYSRTDLPEGTYNVIVKDDYRGCEAEVSFKIEEPELPKDAAIVPLTVCFEETGELNYDISNFKCANQPVNVVIMDDAGIVYDEKALPAKDNYIFIVRDADGQEINRQFFNVGSYASIITENELTHEGCTTLGAIDLELAKSADNYDIKWEDLVNEEQVLDRIDLKEGTYFVTITDKTEGGCSINRTYQINKNTEIIANLNPFELTCDNTPVQVNLKGEDIVSYIWTPMEAISLGQGTATPTINVATGESATVSVNVTNKLGCMTRKDVKIVSVNTKPTGDIKVSPQCDGLTLDFSSPEGSSEYYRWDFGDGNFSDKANPKHTYAQEGDYVIKLRLKPDVPCAEEVGVITSRDLKLVAEAKAVADFTFDYNACEDEGTISFKDASTINPGKIDSWNWNFGNGMTSTEQNPVISIAEDADLNVTLDITTSIGCNDTISKTSSFKVIQMPKMQDSLLVCPGMPTELNSNPKEGATYEWSPAELLDNPLAANPIATTFKSVDFSVRITHDGCVREDNIRAEVPKEQEYTLSEDQSVCSDSTQLIFIDAPETSKIEWTNITTGGSLGSDAELMVAPGSYKIQLTDPNNCVITDEVHIENFEIEASINNNTDPCEGGNGLLEVMNDGLSEITNYQWTDADGIISLDLNQAAIEVEPAASTEFTVTLRNEEGCETILTEKVIVANFEDVEVKPERDTIFRGEFTPIHVSPTDGYTIVWNNDPSLDNTASFNPMAMPEATTTYTVTITETVTNCAISRDATVHVLNVACGEPNIFFPNAFSPNGDGNNDILRVRGNAMTEVHFVIYNRWGEKVFESRSQDIGWDGTFEGKQVTPDVYGYYLRVVCATGDVYETQGNVTVLN